MKELIKFELSKIFQRKFIWIVAVLITAVIFIESLNTINSIKATFGSIENYKTELKIYEGEIDPQKQLDFKKEKLRLDEKCRNGEKLTKEESKFSSSFYYLGWYFELNSNPKYLVNDKEYTLSEMNSELSKGNENSYEYRNLEKAYKAISMTEKPQYVYQYGWTRIRDNVDLYATMMVILLLIGISNIFSGEYKTNVIPVILSTPNGRKKLTVVKIISSMIYAICVLVFISLIFFLKGLPFGLDGFNSMINTNGWFEQAPYAMTIIEFYFACLGLSLLGALVLTLFTALLSLLTKNSMITLIIGLGIFFFTVYPSVKILPEVVRYVSVLELIQAQKILSYYNSFNIFGIPVLYPTVIITTALVAILTLVLGIRYFGRRQNV